MSQYNCRFILILLNLPRKSLLYIFSRVLPVGDEWTTTKGFSRPYFGYWSIFWGITCEVRLTQSHVAHPFSEKKKIELTPFYQIEL